MTDQATKNIPRVYDGTFVAMFAANSFLMSAVGLLFRYSDFVEVNGGDELKLGWIVGLGTIGAIAFRVFQAVLIDRIGVSIIWTVSLLLFIVGAIWHTQLPHIESWHVYGARILLASGIAGALGSWATFASLRAPLDRVAEVIGIAGASGFVGMAIGPTIGDALLASDGRSQTSIAMMFYVAAGLAVASLFCAWIANRPGQLRPFASGNPQVKIVRKRSWPIIKKHQPGLLLVVAITMGVGGAIPSTFLRPYTESIGIDAIASYFWTYNVTAFTCRIVFRRASHVVGLKAMILIGLGAMAVSMPLYLIVRSPFWLFVPAIAAGVSHCFLFPAVMSSGIAKFPIENRGLAMNFMFAMYDIGLALGAPILGVLLSFTRNSGFDSYTVMFVGVGVYVASVGILFAKSK